MASVSVSCMASLFFCIFRSIDIFFYLGAYGNRNRGRGARGHRFWTLTIYIPCHAGAPPGGRGRRGGGGSR